ncbi:hypothetical protein DXA70_06440 [Faecalibacterium sp. OF04-11AC]|nr:hypothetical protein DXA70_06440 [Faecalibacterium sp. OF04-11AC]
MTSIETMARKHTIMIATQVAFRMTTASESTKNSLCAAVQKNYSIDIDIEPKNQMPLHENCRGFFFSHFSRKYTKIHTFTQKPPR